MNVGILWIDIPTFALVLPKKKCKKNREKVLTNNKK